jgi:hypothetical protein
MFASASGGIIFLKFFVLGLVCGLFGEIFRLICDISKNNIAICNMLGLVFFCAVGIGFTILNLTLNNGKIVVYTILATIVGIKFEQISVGFFFTKAKIMVYNTIRKMFIRISGTKFGGKVLR